jgi:integrase
LRDHGGDQIGTILRENRMASKPFFDASKGAWFIKWKAGAGRGWVKQKLCPHPGWSEGQRIPKKAPPEASRLARVWEDKENRARSGIEVDDRPTDLRTFLDGYILTAEASQTEGSLAILRRVAKIFVAWCETRGIKAVQEVTVQTCREFMATRAKAKGIRGAGLAYKTLKTERGTLAPAWSQAFQDGRVASNPWERAPVPGKPRAERPPFWTEAEVAKLAAACVPWLGDVVVVGAYSGLRITSLLGLEWRDVSFDAGTIHVRAGASKTGVAYDAPMLSKARDVLERRRFVAHGILVFPGPKRGKEVPSNRTYQAIKRAVKRSGVPDRGTYNHSLRHSFATWAVNRGVPLSIVARWMGHTSTQQTERYAHADPSETARWAERFETGLDGGGHSPPDP